MSITTAPLQYDRLQNPTDPDDPKCAGPNCGALAGEPHSPACQAQHAASIGYDARTAAGYDARAAARDMHEYMARLAEGLDSGRIVAMLPSIETEVFGFTSRGDDQGVMRHAPTGFVTYTLKVLDVALAREAWIIKDTPGVVLLSTDNDPWGKGAPCPPDPEDGLRYDDLLAVAKNASRWETAVMAHRGAQSAAGHVTESQLKAFAEAEHEAEANLLEIIGAVLPEDLNDGPTLSDLLGQALPDPQ